jgi:hypothetical protein
MMLASGRFEPNGSAATLSIHRDDGLFCARSEPLRPDADLVQGRRACARLGLNPVGESACREGHGDLTCLDAGMLGGANGWDFSVVGGDPKPDRPRAATVGLRRSVDRSSAL